MKKIISIAIILIFTLSMLSIVVYASEEDKELEDGYYFSDINGTIADITSTDMFKLSDETSGFYVLEKDTIIDQCFKVVKVRNGEIQETYPKEDETGYKIDEEHVGYSTIFFSAGGNTQWEKFDGHINIETEKFEKLNEPISLYFIAEDDSIDNYIFYSGNISTPLECIDTGGKMLEKKVYEIKNIPYKNCVVYNYYKVTVDGKEFTKYKNYFWDPNYINSNYVLLFNSTKPEYKELKFDDEKKEENPTKILKSQKLTTKKGYKSYTLSFDKKYVKFNRIKSTAKKTKITYKYNVIKTSNKKVIKEGRYTNKIRFRNSGIVKINVEVTAKAKGYKPIKKLFKSIKVVIKPGELKKSQKDKEGFNSIGYYYKRSFKLKNKCRISGYIVQIYSGGKDTKENKLDEIMYQKSKNSFQVGLKKYSTLTIKICAYYKVGSKKLCGDWMKYTATKK